MEPIAIIEALIWILIAVGLILVAIWVVWVPEDYYKAPTEIEDDEDDLRDF